MQYLVQGSDALAQYKDFVLRGRKEELDRIAAILMRGNSNSLLLVGPGGVGCTALVLGLQAMKAEKNAPFDIVGKRFLWLNSDELFALGNVESIKLAFDDIIRLLDRTAESVLVIEDIKDFIEGARNIGCSHFINAIFMLMHNNRTQVIFETRDEDLDTVLKCHSDMRESLTMFDLTEPVGAALTEIVKDSADKLSSQFQIKITDSAVSTAIELTTKYRSRDAGLNRAQPERSITLLDRALATYRLAAHQGPSAADPEWDRLQEDLRQVYKEFRSSESQLFELEQKLSAQREEDAQRRQDAGNVVSKFAIAMQKDSKEAQEIAQQLHNVSVVLEENRNKYNTITAQINASMALTRELVLIEFSKISGISTEKLNENERAKLIRLEDTLKSRIFGQDAVCKHIADAVKTGKIGKRDKNPIAFMFLGPSGVGKTEMAKVLATALYDDVEALEPIFDMSEYMSKHATDKLIGAPPGYEGFEAGGILTNIARKNPNRPYLFDEIEKADPAVFNIFLQILRGGRLTDNVGRKCFFDQAIIVMTSNIGQAYFLDDSLTKEEAKQKAMDDLQAWCQRSEFLNRFAGRQNILVFEALELDSILKIMKREIQQLNQIYSSQGITIEISDSDLADFCADHYEKKIGAVGLPSYVKVVLEPLMVNYLLEGTGFVGILETTYNRDTKSFNTRIVHTVTLDKAA